MTVSLDAEILAIVSAAVKDATERAAKSKECMSPEEARRFLGLTVDEFKKRRHLIPARVESERKRYYLREDLIAYLKGLPVSGCALGYGQHEGAPDGTGTERFTA